ncbi:nuclear receptor subfamily 0 group b member 1 [Plakobranchus ocellatus]|uniref:Nuclear receptor subfamily 0 group b member 1 n=1 Tax=Plakobranchus ocellatus TaxID=259542 RepID=A0AAV4AK77_9GAST|nr:nuclear receptor subfamily 0 group b member 1 [Plakobranchus ocellatus]
MAVRDPRLARRALCAETDKLPNPRCPHRKLWSLHPCASRARGKKQHIRRGPTSVERKILQPIPPFIFQLPPSFIHSQKQINILPSSTSRFSPPTLLMEVLHRSVGSVFGGLSSGHQGAGAVMYPPGLQRVFMSPADVYSCFPYEANTPSRTPTPEHPGPRGKQAPPMDFSSQATTLQSVLRGEIPAAYSHLTSSTSLGSSASSSSSSSQSKSCTSSSAMPTLSLPPSSSSSLSTSSSHLIDIDHQSQCANNARPFHHGNPPPLLFYPGTTPSPCPSYLSSSVSCSSPRPQSRPHSHESYESDMQTEPMDLSCKSPMTTTQSSVGNSNSLKAPRKRTAVSAFLDVASNSTSSSVSLSSSLPAKFSNNSRTLSAEYLNSSSASSPSTASPSMHSFPPSPGDGQHGGEEFSLLRNLLSVGKHHQNSSSSSSSSGLSSSTPNLTSPPSPFDPLASTRGCDSPASDHSSSSSTSTAFARAPVTGNTRVQLAKKNLLPVSARVSDWLDKAVRFAKSIPEFAALSQKDQTTLVLSSWARLVLLYMAEANFQFAVTPHSPRVSPAGSDSAPTSVAPPPTQDEPTMKSVEGVQTFIRKCQQMQVDAREYEFLRMLVLFNAGKFGLLFYKYFCQ